MPEHPFTIDNGYVREAGEEYNPTAVRWWHFASSEDGFRFARGGRVATARAARSELEGCWTVYERERDAWLKRRTHVLVEGTLRRRPTHELDLGDGSLKPLMPTDFEIS